MTKRSAIRLEPNGPVGVGLTRMELDVADFQTELPEQNWHLYHEDDVAGLYVGVWTTTDMQEAFGPYPGDEFMVLLEGDAIFVDGDGQEARVECGETFAVKNGLPVSWKQQGFCRKFFVIHSPPERRTPESASTEGGINILREPDLAARLVPTGDWKEAIAHVNDTADLEAGLRESGQDVSVKIQSSDHEFVYVLSGQVRLTNDNDEQCFEAGEAYFAPAGTAYIWSTDTKTRTFFCRVGQAAQGGINSDR